MNAALIEAITLGVAVPGFLRLILCSSETAANSEGEQLAFPGVILSPPKKEDELVKQNQWAATGKRVILTA